MPARRQGRAQLLEKNIRPRDIITKASLTNAMTAIAAIGGSTNGVLHILAVAREAGVDFTLRDVQAICRRTPVLCNFAPRGRGTMVDLHRLGGTSMLLKHLMKTGLLDGSCITVTGQTLAENLATAAKCPSRTTSSHRIDAPFKDSPTSRSASATSRRTAWSSKFPHSTNRVSPAARSALPTPKAFPMPPPQGRIKPGHIVVIRGCGPVGLGMPEMHVASAALAVPELYGKVALISDTRVSGVSGGAVGVHCSPEAVVGGPIARVQDGMRSNSTSSLARSGERRSGCARADDSADLTPVWLPG
jgi:dihydroxy-acid dehydratase